MNGFWVCDFGLGIATTMSGEAHGIIACNGASRRTIPRSARVCDRAVQKTVGLQNRGIRKTTCNAASLVVGNVCGVGRPTHNHGSATKGLFLRNEPKCAGHGIMVVRGSPD